MFFAKPCALWFVGPLEILIILYVPYYVPYYMIYRRLIMCQGLGASASHTSRFDRPQLTPMLLGLQLRLLQPADEAPPQVAHLAASEAWEIMGVLVLRPERDEEKHKTGGKTLGSWNISTS